MPNPAMAFPPLFILLTWRIWERDPGAAERRAPIVRGRTSGILRLTMLRRFCEFHFCLLQPVTHSHLSEHRRGSRKVLFGRQMISRSQAQLANAKMTMGDEGTHAQLLRQREGLL
jgi:hypothetical protein